LLTSAVVALLGCRPAAPPRHPVGAAGQWHVVQPGETLAEIARRAGVPAEDLLEINGLRAPSEVQPGKLIFVLQGPPPQAPSPDPTLDRPAPSVPVAELARFHWPVETPRVTSLFGKRWGRPHEGIDLTAPVGTPVFAAGVGQVVYSGSAVRGYGNMVVLKHEGEFMTVYAHNSVLLVKVGDHVRAGQRIALSGQSGHATGPHVHFEVRKGQVPCDPLPYLPSARQSRTPREWTPRS
jgi:murein DD-endopeptidase MepM/ murein hydrolase activator NlpD